MLLGWLAPGRAPALIPVGSISGVDARDVQLVGRLAFVADYSFGLRVVDVSNPVAPVLIGGLAAPGALSIALEGDLALLSVVLPNLPLVIDVSDPEAPRERARIADPKCWGRARLVDRIAYVAGNGLCILDLSKPSRPRRLAVLPGAFSDVEVTGDVAFLTTTSIFTGSLVLVDVSKPTAPSELSHIDFAPPSSPSSLAVAGDVAWVSDYYNNGLISIDVSDPRAPAEIETKPLFEFAQPPRDLEI